METRQGRAAGARVSVGSSRVRPLSDWVQLGSGQFRHRTDLAELGFLVPGCDLALHPTDMVTLSLADRAAQGAGENFRTVVFDDDYTLFKPKDLRRVLRVITKDLLIWESADTDSIDWMSHAAAASLSSKLLSRPLMVGLATKNSSIADLASTTGSVAAHGRHSASADYAEMPCAPTTLCCPTDARVALQALEGADLTSPLPPLRVCMAPGAGVAARSGGDSCMPWALSGTPPENGVPGIAAGELNTAFDISSRFAKCKQLRQADGLVARKSAEPSEWQGWEIEVQTRESARAELRGNGRKVCNRRLAVQVNISRVGSSSEHPELPLPPWRTLDERKAARKTDERKAAAKLFSQTPNRILS
ncbi:hypothetical protein T492DRAFT_866166 [Pavlovales sp. CCMP2436]|nr:hypothetical protein T492DRAFT_866166 [Pavlovales sp. CCMP2436]